MLAYRHKPSVDLDAGCAPPTANRIAAANNETVFVGGKNEVNISITCDCPSSFPPLIKKSIPPLLT